MFVVVNPQSLDLLPSETLYAGVDNSAGSTTAYKWSFASSRSKSERDALESQVRERTARLTELATYLQQAAEDERAHLARELHDELGSLLTAAKLNVARIKSKLPKDADELAERLKHLTETLNQGIV